MDDSRHNCQFMFDKIPCGVFCRNADGSIFAVNPAAEKIIGVSREILERHVPYLPEMPVILENGDTLPPEQYPSMVALRRGNEVRDFVIGLYNPQRREYLWVNVNAFPQFRDGEQSPCRVFVTLHDVTGEKHAIELLRQSDERNRALLNIVDTQTEFVDRFLPGGIITFANDAICRYAGIPREELLGRSFFEFVHEDERESLVRALEGLVPENPTMHTVGRVLLPDGSLRWHQWTNTAVFDGSGTIVEYQSVGRDITEQKIAEDELAYANECFAQALDGPAHILYRLNVTKGCYDYMSPSFEKITGHRIAEFRNNSLETLKEFFHPEDRARIFASIDEAFRLRSGKAVNFDLEYRLRKADGDYCWLHDLNTACFNDHGELECFFGSAYDITSAKRIEELLRASEERFRSIMALSPDIISIIAADGQLAYNSPATLAIHGYTEEDLASRNTFDLIHPDDRQSVGTALQKLFELPSLTQTVQYRYRNKDGTYRWMEATASNQIHNPHVGGLITISRDISGRKQMETGLRLSEERYRRFIATANEGICITDKDYVITYVNSSLAEMLGYLPDELVGVPVDRLLHPDEQEGFRLQSESRRYGISGRRECVHLRKDGSQVWLLTSSTPVMGDAGEFQGCFAMFTDLSDRKKAEIALQKANDELELRVAERTAALGKAYEQIKRMTFELIRAEERERMRIASELHDQVGQSLLLIKMKLDMLASEMESEPLRDTAEAISFLLECSLQDIRSLTFNMRPPLLETAGLSAALEWLCTSIRRDYGLLVDFTSCGEPFSGDIEVSHSIYQAVRELLLNVVKHAGVFRSELFMKVDADTIVVRVADRGVGLDRADEADRRDDSGFGLFNVQQRIGQLGGSFCIESAPDSGTVVTLTIPLQGSATKGGTMSLKILLVDDHTILREGLRSLIEKEPDAEVVGEAADGAAAIRLTEELRPDLVIMDLTMPVMNGMDATRIIVKKHPEVRVLALSMENDRFFVVEALKAGATGYLLKDSAFAELSEAIHAVARGETFLPVKIATLLVRDFLQCIPEDMSPVYDKLTSREREILSLVADGKNTKEISFALGTSIKTVENQRSAIMQKLNLFSIAELTKYAVRSGLSPLKR